jgi:hypothetical protein
MQKLKGKVTKKPAVKPVTVYIVGSLYNGRILFDRMSRNLKRLKSDLDRVWHPCTAAFQARFEHAQKPIFMNDALDGLATEFIFQAELDD